MSVCFWGCRLESKRVIQHNVSHLRPLNVTLNESVAKLHWTVDTNNPRLNCGDC